MLKKILLGIGLASIVLCSVVEAATGTKIRSGPSGNSLQERIALALQDQMDTDGSFTDLWIDNFQVRDFAIDDATPDVGTGTLFRIVGSNTAANAIQSFDNLTAGKVFYIVGVSVGGANQSTFGSNTTGTGILTDRSLGTFTAANADVIAFLGISTSTAVEMFRINNLP